MSKRKKGLSVDEKRSVLLEIFHENQQFYQLKEVEKIAAKEKGLKEQIVKELLQSLVDDGMVESDKIGTSTYFWSFPAKKRKLKEVELGRLQKEIEQCDVKIGSLEKQVEEEKKLHDDSTENGEVLEQLQTLQDKESDLQEKITKIKQSDKTALRKMRKSLPKLHEAANRWTDNVFALKSWCRKRFNVDETVLEKQFQIPAELDYLE